MTKIDTLTEPLIFQIIHQQNKEKAEDSSEDESSEESDDEPQKKKIKVLISLSNYFFPLRFFICILSIYAQFSSRLLLLQKL